MHSQPPFPRGGHPSPGNFSDQDSWSPAPPIHGRRPPAPGPHDHHDHGHSHPRPDHRHYEHFPHQHRQPEAWQCAEPIYPYNKPGKHVLVDLINRANETDFAPDQLEISAPAALGNTLTQVHITPTHKTGWCSSETFTYHRMIMEAYLGKTHIHLHVDARMTKESVAQAMRDRYRIWLDMEDFDVDFSNCPPSWLQRGHFLARLRFRPNCLIWIGAMEVILIPDNRLSAMICVTDLSGFIYPDHLGGQGRKQLAESYYQDLEGTIIYQNLLKYRVGEPVRTHDGKWRDGTRLTGDFWISSPQEVEFNVSGARIVYNGRNEGPWHCGCNDYSHVLVIELSHLCKNLRGKLVIPYDVRREQPF